MGNAIVLGAGMVGSVMAADLAADPGMSVSIADVSERNLGSAERTSIILLVDACGVVPNRDPPAIGRLDLNPYLQPKPRTARALKRLAIIEEALK